MDVPSTTTTFFEKAKSLFPLNKNAEAATEGAWKTYITNRLVAERKYPGSKEGKPKSAKDEEGDEDDEDDEDDDFGIYGNDEKYVMKAIRREMASLEGEMKLDEGVLSKAFRRLSCEALFEEADDPRTVTTLTRIYSPTRPVYIDVHFQYHCRGRAYSIEWHYSLGFKIYNRPGTNDYHPSEVKKFERGSFDSAHSGNGWRPIAYGFFDDCGEYGRKWFRVENSKFTLGEDDVKDLYEALWGPLDDNRGDDDQGDDEEDEEIEKRSKMVNSVRVLLAAAGINYTIGIDDGEEDEVGIFMLEGLGDRWFARGVRKACGFQLTEDPENEKKGREEREEEMKGTDDEDEWDSDEDGYGSF